MQQQRLEQRRQQLDRLTRDRTIERNPVAAISNKEINKWRLIIARSKVSALACRSTGNKCLSGSRLDDWKAIGFCRHQWPYLSISAVRYSDLLLAFFSLARPQPDWLAGSRIRHLRRLGAKFSFGQPAARLAGPRQIFAAAAELGLATSGAHLLPAIDRLVGWCWSVSSLDR